MGKMHRGARQASWREGASCYLHAALGLALPLFLIFLAACGAAQGRGPTSTTVTSADAVKEAGRAPAAKAAARAVAAAAPRDACTAYAVCVEQIPPADLADGSMHAPASTIRSWARTPEQLRQCTAAHDLARAGGLCR